MTDNDRLTYGQKFKGEKMANVPAWYLLWMLEENKGSKEELEYIEKNYDILKEEIDE